MRGCKKGGVSYRGVEGAMSSKKEWSPEGRGYQKKKETEGGGRTFHHNKSAVVSRGTPGGRESKKTLLR